MLILYVLEFFSCTSNILSDVFHFSPSARDGIKEAKLKYSNIDGVVGCLKKAGTKQVYYNVDCRTLEKVRNFKFLSSMMMKTRKDLKYFVFVYFKVFVFVYFFD